MLRVVALLLLLANAAYFAWSQGLLADWGAAPTQQAEPHRLGQQINPQSVRVIPASEANRVETSAAGATRPPDCLQAGLFAEADSGTLRRVLDAWPSGSWSLEPGAEPARWIVYMGKYPDAEHVTRKKSELRFLGVSFEPLANASLEPGLSLGAYATQEQANQHLETLAGKGVRTAKVVQERAEARGQWLRLAAVDDGVRGRLDDLKAALGGKLLQPCR